MRNPKLETNTKFKIRILKTIASARSLKISSLNPDLFRISILGFRVLQFASGFAFVRILCADGERDPATRGELRGDDCFTRHAGFYEIVQDVVGDRLVERALVAIRRQVKLERLTFDAETVGYVIDVNSGKIGLFSNGTNGSEIVCLKMNPIIAIGRWIREGLQARFGWRGWKFRVAVPKQC
jgi:hypothetical protein